MKIFTNTGVNFEKAVRVMVIGISLLTEIIQSEIDDPEKKKKYTLLCFFPSYIDNLPGNNPFAVK